jgi:hypothetical protein
MTISVIFARLDRLARSARMRPQHHVVLETATRAHGRCTLALDSKNFFIPTEKFVQQHEKDATPHGLFDRTTELRGLGIETSVGAITMGDPGGDIEPVTGSSGKSGCAIRPSFSARAAATASRLWASRYNMCCSSKYFSFAGVGLGPAI